MQNFYTFWQKWKLIFLLLHFRFTWRIISRTIQLRGMAEKTRGDLAENDVEYRLYPAVSGDNVKQSLEGLLDEILASISHFIVDFIWQNEPFRLCIVTEGKQRDVIEYTTYSTGNKLEQIFLTLVWLGDLIVFLKLTFHKSQKGTACADRVQTIEHYSPIELFFMPPAWKVHWGSSNRIVRLSVIPSHLQTV